MRSLPKGLLILVVGGLLSCGQVALSGLSWPGEQSQTPIPIAQLQQFPLAAEPIYLRGQVRDRVPFLASGAYQLQDETGSIWVYTEAALPAKGEEVWIQGQLEYESIIIERQQLGEIYIRELEKLEGS